MLKNSTVVIPFSKFNQVRSTSLQDFKILCNFHNKFPVSSRNQAIIVFEEELMNSNTMLTEMSKIMCCHNCNHAIFTEKFITSWKDSMEGWKVISEYDGIIEIEKSF